MANSCAALSFSLLGVLLASTAQAALLPHTDLAGLVWQSNAVVIAERGAPAVVANGAHSTLYRVTRILRGSAKLGEELALFDDGYTLDGSYQGAAHPLPVSPTAVLFLKRATDDPTAPKVALVLTGLRLISDGKLYRFEQWSNPGGLVPVPQGQDPDDARGLSSTGPVDIPAFERMLSAASARVDALHAALALPDPAARRTRVLATLGASRNYFAEPTSRGHGFYDDVFGEAAVEALNTAGDLDGALAAHASVHGERHFMTVAAKLLVGRALDEGAPIAVRWAALETIANASDLDLATEKSIAMLARAANAPEVRSAALAVIAQLTGRMDEGGRAAERRRRATWRAVSADVAKNDKDPRVVARVRSIAEQHGLASQRR